MIRISVCVGSSCHLKGSYQVIQEFRSLIADNDLEDDVQLAGSFCLASCGEGVAVRIGGELHHVAGDPGAVDELFEKYVRPQLGV